MDFKKAPLPEIFEIFKLNCTKCEEETEHTRVITRHEAAELRRRQEEADLKEFINKECKKHNIRCRFVYQSVVISTDLADWCFDYHQKLITLYHENKVKINFATGDYAKAHVQFRNRKLTIPQVIEYIVTHDAWRAEQSRQE